MSSYNYVENVNGNLICCICRAPFLNPTVTETCSHTFCRECILKALEVSPCCPVDRSPLNISDLRSENLLLRNMVDELLVECVHRPAGCAHTCQRQLLNIHLRDLCEYVQVACSEDGCDQTVLRRDLGKHAHDCVHRVVTCKACGTAVRAMELESHHSNCLAQDVTCPFCLDTIPRSELAEHNTICPEYLVPCSQAANGCPWTGPRIMLEVEHLPQCPYESIKGFFVLNDSRLSSLRTENAFLKQKMDEMQASIDMMRQDLETARCALGPWWRPESTSRRSESDLPSQRDQEDGRRGSISLPGVHGFSSERSTPRSDNGEVFYSIPPYADHDFLAPYFPPAHNEASGGDNIGVPVPQTSADYHYRRRSVGMASGGSGGGFTQRHADIQRATPPSNLTVAPIDLSTTLEGALASLRSSIVTLSASLDSLSRRQDIALTAENLRMTEEIGALRGVIHGLRMQVHSIMMERNKQITGRSGDSSHDGHYYQPVIPLATTSTTKL